MRWMEKSNLVLTLPIAFLLMLRLADCQPAEQEQSQVAAPAVQVERDIPYLTPGRTEKLDLYRPAGMVKDRKYPGIVVIHGGSWQGGEKNGPIELDFATKLSRAGYICVSIDYVLSQKGHPAWPQILYDCKFAVQFLRKFACRYQVDAGHIGVIGDSAGGHLALMVGLTGGQRALEPGDPYRGISSRVQAVVSFYGPTNLPEWHDGQESCELLLGAPREQVPALWHLASPVNQVSTDDPPTLVVHGSKDKGIPVSQAQELDAILQQRGVQHELLVLEGAPHAFSLQWRQVDLRPRVVGFFDQYLKRKR